MATKAVVSLFLLSLVCFASGDYITDALNDFFVSTNGPNWIQNGGWGTSDPFCTWWGIRCNPGNTTFNISLDGDRVAGSIPNSFGNLGKSLISLELDRNEITGTIPSSLTNLTKLVEFDISQNELTGTVPAGFGNFTDITMFWISDNDLTGYLPEDLQSVLEQVVKFQANLGCRLAGNNFCCEVPKWVPTECGMGCNYNTTCEVDLKAPVKYLKIN